MSRLPIAKLASLTDGQRNEVLSFFDHASREKLAAASQSLINRVGKKNLRALSSILTEKELGVDRSSAILKSTTKAKAKDALSASFDLSRLDAFWRKKLISALDKKEIKVLNATLAPDEYALLSSTELPSSLKAALIELCRA